MPANPLLLLQYSPKELGSKPGGGKTPEPLVPITSAYRNSLAVALENIAEAAAGRRASTLDPVPVKVTLREKALAKSNRPYAMLAANALPPVAAEGDGELVVGGTPGLLRGLAAAIRNAQSKKDLYFISTFESFALWDIANDAFGVKGDSEAQGVLEGVRAQNAVLKVTFFPWTARLIQRAVKPQAAVSGGHDKSRDLVQIFSQVLGMNVSTANLSESRPVVYVAGVDVPDLDTIRKVHGVRSVGPAPRYRPIQSTSDPDGFRRIRELGIDEVELPKAGTPVVGVFDSGVDATALESAVVGRRTFDPDALRDATHGTFVAGLVAGAAQMNVGKPVFPDDQARVFDAQVLSLGDTFENVLYDRIADTLESRSQDIKVWNCSFGSGEMPRDSYGTFAYDLDELADRHGVLFITAAGNTAGGNRPWPPVVGTSYGDGLGTPAEALRSVTVGARAHLGGFVPAEAPASYSRRGPNFAQHVKPDISHWGGDVDVAGKLNGFGTRSIIPSGHIAESVGTSFSAPLVSSIAANVWKTVEEARGATPSPELVKGLLVHSAFTNAVSRDRLSSSPEHRPYYGWGTPSPSSAILNSEAEEFTTVHEVVLTAGGAVWTKRPFPVPEVLITPDGRFRGEVILTVAYAPPINIAFGVEAVRYDVSGAFGRYKVDKQGKRGFHGVTPHQRSHGWESNQIADGKWAPIKTYYSRHPNGVAGDEWALRLELTERVSSEVGREQRVYALITFRSIEDGIDVYNSGIAALNKLRYASESLVPATRVRLDGIES